MQFNDKVIRVGVRTAQRYFSTGRHFCKVGEFNRDGHFFNINVYGTYIYIYINILGFIIMAYLYNDL